MTRENSRDDRRAFEQELEQVADDLLLIVAQRAYERMDIEDPRNVAFIEWQARNLRDRRTPAEAHADRLLAADLARRIVQRISREEFAVQDANGYPALRRAPDARSIASAVDSAAAEQSAPHMDLAVAAGIGRELWDEECVEWAAVPNSIPPGRHLALRVAGQSMMPYLHPGDTVLVRLGDSLVRGRIVVARRPDDGYVIKRVGKVRRHEVELVSLNPDFGPIIVPRDSRLILGTVVLRWCAHGAPRDA